MVAPDTFKRELLRIEESSNLGVLEVNDSCISGEVVSNFIQDECKLKRRHQNTSIFPFVKCTRLLSENNRNQ